MSEDEITERANSAAQKIVDVYQLKDINPAYISSIIREEFGDTRCHEVQIPDSVCFKGKVG